MTIHLWVTNSSAVDNLVVAIEIDGEDVFNQAVPRSTGHGYVKGEIELPQGQHSLRATAGENEISLQKVLEVDDELWVRVILMNNERGDGQQFMLDVSRSKPALK